MNGRELYGTVYDGQRTDRLPVPTIWAWTETVQRWRQEGLGPQENPNVALGLAHDQTMDLPLDLNMVPAFDLRILQETPEHIILVDEYGVTKKILQADYDRSGGRMGAAGTMSCMPQWLDYPVKDMATWKAIYEQRFCATAEGRVPEDWPQQKADFQERSQSRWVCHFSFPFGGLFSALRQLMGLEPALYALFDAPELIRTIVNDLAQFYLDCYALVLPEVRLDQIIFFEDMCATKAPMISPEMFEAFIAPAYRRLLGGLREMHVRQLFIDTDGDARLILPAVKACGFTACCPCEVNAHMDAGALRRAMPDLCLCGGIDKRAVARGGRVMTEEVARRFQTAWALGRYVPTLDHGAPPDISWDNIRQYARLAIAWSASPQGPKD